MTQNERLLSAAIAKRSEIRNEQAAIGKFIVGSLWCKDESRGVRRIICRAMLNSVAEEEQIDAKIIDLKQQIAAQAEASPPS
ncbi:MAG: hypothetical protein JWN70_6387 [Planctomycetaceae bacterium]|nr:hypothetical protein [Planctomycetaceae bacterium]